MGRRSAVSRMAGRPARTRRRGVTAAGRVRAVAGPVVLATDAAVGGREWVGTAYVSTTGHVGVRAHLYPEHLVQSCSRVVVAELRAINQGLTDVLREAGGRPVEVRTDSVQALSFLHAWQRGGVRMPEGYDLSARSGGVRPGLERLQMLVEFTPGLTFVHEKGHAGHPLNETADSLAKMGLRCVRGYVSAELVEPLMLRWAEGGLAEFRREREHGPEGGRGHGSGHGREGGRGGAG